MNIGHDTLLFLSPRGLPEAKIPATRGSHTCLSSRQRARIALDIRANDESGQGKAKMWLMREIGSAALLALSLEAGQAGAAGKRGNYRGYNLVLQQAIGEQRVNS